MTTPGEHRANVAHLLGETVLYDAPGRGLWEPRPERLASELRARTNGSGAERDEGSGGSGPLSLYTDDELAALPAATWQVGPSHEGSGASLSTGVLPAGGTCFLIGRRSTFKTFIALDLAASVATGTDWHGHKTTPATVVYVAGEGRSGISARLAAIRTARGVASTGVLVHPSPLALLTLASADRLADGVLTKLGNTTKDLFIVFDTLHRCIKGGDENDSAIVGLVYATLDRVRDRIGTVTALLLHHPPKLGEDGRGSSAWGDDADAVWSVEREAGSRLVTLKNTKQKDAEEHEPITLELIPAGESLVVTSHGADWTLTDHRTLTRGERKALQAVADFHPEAISWTRWKETGGLAESSLSAHRKRLLSLGYIEVETHGHYCHYKLTGAGMAALT